MESASTLHTVSFGKIKKSLRKGQQRVVDEALLHGVTTLNAQLPTGYGKTYTACCVYKELQQRGSANRLLYIVPSVAQLEQFVNDGASDLIDAGVVGSVKIVDVSYVGVVAIKHHRQDKAQVFATTIQSLASGNAWDIIAALMETGRWMVVVDEYHHYGVDKHWGRQVSRLNYAFRLAMSATPYRPDDDSAFGKPDVVVSYRDAVLENAVKRLLLHSYVYQVDVVNPDGTISSYTTGQIADEAGSDNPEAIEKMMMQRKMRWSPKYVSPLVDHPIARMQRDRLITGLPLQVLVGAMCCSHAELVCGQLRAMFPELRIDWVGTGPDGRENKDNRKILEKFCPPKRDGKRNPEDIGLDVLVHVGMAGEGLDSVYVSEVVHLNSANINNSNNQENGRAARYLSGVIGCINVDSSSPYAAYVGESVMDLMDNPNAKVKKDPSDDQPNHQDDDDDWSTPDTPTINIYDMECIDIVTGEVSRFGQAMLRAGGLDEAGIAAVFDDPNNPNHDAWMRIAEKGYRDMRKREAESFNAKAVVAQWDDAVKSLAGVITSGVIKIITASGMRVEKSLAGDIKKRINQRKAREVGHIEKDEETLQRHWYWLKNLESSLKSGEVPTWLR